MDASTSTSAPLVSLAAIVAASMVLAQWQVNTQVPARVNNRAGGELYGNMGSVKYAAYPQTRLLPSEERYATWKSGALPSDVRMGAAAGGPMTPNGVINYLPGPTAMQKTGRAPVPQLTNPAYGIDARVDSGPIPMAGYGTIKYAPQATTSAGPYQVSGAAISNPAVSGAVSGAALPTGQVTGQVGAPAPSASMTTQLNGAAPTTIYNKFLQSSPLQQNGSIRYSSPGLTAPGDKPATQ